MRRTILLFAAALLLVSVVGSVPASAGSSDPFAGAWKAIDLDGSKMTLAIGAGGEERHVTLVDEYCAPFGYPCKAVGWGEVDNYTLHVTARWQETHGLGQSDWWQNDVTYDPTTGSLSWFGVQWVRAGQ